MPRRPRSVYVPLDVDFFDNDKVLSAVEKAGWLYLAMCCRAKSIVSDGVLSAQQIERLGVQGWRQRMARLLDTRLVVALDDGRYLIVGFLERNPSAAELLEHRRRDAARKGVGSARIPGGIQPESGAEGKGREEKRREVDVDRTTDRARGLRVVGGDAS